MYRRPVTIAFPKHTPLISRSNRRMNEVPKLRCRESVLGSVVVLVVYRKALRCAYAVRVQYVLETRSKHENRRHFST